MSRLEAFGAWVILAVFAILVIAAVWDAWQEHRRHPDDLLDEWLPPEDPRRTSRWDSGYDE